MTASKTPQAGRARAQQAPATPPQGMHEQQERLAWYARTARLAPSKHNTQPWRFVVSHGALDVHADRSRALPATDPDGRELVLSCGAAVEAARCAAASLGIELEVEPFPDGSAGPVARLREGGRRPVERRDRELLGAVASRRTDRGPLDGGLLPPELPFALRDLAAARGCSLRLVTSPGDRSAFARVLALADQLLAQRPEAEAELRAWVRSGPQDRRDGVAAEATRGPRASYVAAFRQRDFSAPGAPALHDREGTDAPLVGVLCTTEDRPDDWLAAGQALMAVLLAVTRAGGNASYLNQPLELPPTRTLLRDELGLQGRPQMVLRLGVGGRVAPSPRRPAHEVVTVDERERPTGG